MTSGETEEGRIGDLLTCPTLSSTLYSNPARADYTCLAETTVNTDSSQRFYALFELVGAVIVGMHRDATAKASPAIHHMGRIALGA